MESIRLGRSGLKVSPVVLGTAAFGDPERTAWSVGADAVWPLVRRASEVGVTTFDTGNTYGGGLAEARLGEALRKLGGRQGVILTTKAYFPTGPGANDRGLSRKHLLDAVDQSLQRLQTDYVDLLMVHRWDATTPIEETLATLDQIVRSGRVRYLGASSMSAWRLMKALGLQRGADREPYVAMQGHYNLLYREEEREMIPLCEEEGLGYMAWSPLARGLLAGPQGDQSRLAQDSLALRMIDDASTSPTLAALDALARETAQSHAVLALAWLRAKGAIPVIGAAQPDQIDTAVAAAALSLDAAQVAGLETGYQARSISGFNPRDEQIRA